MRRRVAAILITMVVMMSLTGTDCVHGQSASGKTRAQVYDDIKATLGLVPSFFKLLPDGSLEIEWELMKQVQMVPGPIPNKYRELIGLAISGATKCRYCTFFHTQVAKLNGATDAEIEDAVHYAKTDVGWSTYFYGTQIDLESFKIEIARAIEHMKSMDPSAIAALPPTGGPPRGRAEIEKEITVVFGMVPEFFKSLPDASVQLEWDVFRKTELEPTPIPDKYKSLIGLALASATKCLYCTYADAEFARLAGATDAEIEDAVHYAKSTAGWSTYLNGMQVDYDQFTKEITAACDYVRGQSAKKK